MVRRLGSFVVAWSCALLVPLSLGADETAPPPESASALTRAGETGMSGPQGEEEKPTRFSMEFQDANLGDVLKTFSQQTGINVIAGVEIADRPITVYLEDVEPLDALDQILAAGNLTYERAPGSNIYVVKPKAAEANRTLTRVYRLKYARVSESVLAKVATAFAGKTPFEATVGKVEDTKGGAGGVKVAGGEPVGIDVTLKKLLTEAGSLVVDPRTNSLIITDVPENFPRLEAALAALDVRTAQIMVDSEVIETTLTKLKDLGIKWGVGSAGDFLSVVPATRETAWPFSEGFLGDRWRSSLATDTAITKGSMKFGTVGASSAIAVLQALERDADTKILARPKVLTLDNESAVIRLTANEAIGFQTTTGEQTATTTAQPERTTTGVVLVVTPQVNEDQHVTMIVEPTVTKTVESKINAPTGQATPRDPKTRSSRTLVRIRSGDTLVVGGLIDRSETETVRQVPILSGIPFVGEMFKHSEIDNTASELIVFVTPHIIGEPAATKVASAGKAPFTMREQEAVPSRQELIEETLNRFEEPK